MKPCPTCRRRISNGAHECRHCHRVDPRGYILNGVPSPTEITSKLRPQMRQFLTANGFERVNASWNGGEGWWELEMTRNGAARTNAQVEHILEEMVEQLHFEHRRCQAERYKINGQIGVISLEGRFLAVFSLSEAASTST
jgi:hypothetical protein